MSRDMQIEKQVTYTLELNGEFFLVKNVPARVDEETGEQFFSPSTVEHLQQIVLMQKEPDLFADADLTLAASKLSEVAFSKVWDNPEDTAYDNL
jgi:hypothetical protein